MAAIRNVGVLGCGLMGSGIAEVVAKAGYQTVVREVSAELVGRGEASMRKSLGRAVEKGSWSRPSATPSSAASASPPA